MSESLDNNFIPQDPPNQSFLNYENQENNKKLEFINDASKSYSK